MEDVWKCIQQRAPGEPCSPFCRRVNVGLTMNTEIGLAKLAVLGFNPHVFIHQVYLPFIGAMNT